MLDFLIELVANPLGRTVLPKQAIRAPFQIGKRQRVLARQFGLQGVERGQSQRPGGAVALQRFGRAQHAARPFEITQHLAVRFDKVILLAALELAQIGLRNFIGRAGLGVKGMFQRG